MASADLLSAKCIGPSPRKKRATQDDKFESRDDIGRRNCDDFYGWESGGESGQR